MKINGSGMMELLLTSVTGLVDNQETMVLMKIVVLSGSILIGMMLAVTQTTCITFVKEKVADLFISPDRLDIVYFLLAGNWSIRQSPKENDKRGTLDN